MRKILNWLSLILVNICSIAGVFYSANGSHLLGLIMLTCPLPILMLDYLITTGIMKELRKTLLRRRIKNKKIKILKKAKSYYIKWDFFLMGICHSICFSINSIFKTNISIDNIPEYLPEFTRDNVYRLSNIYGFKGPSYDSPYWWSVYDRETRIKAFDALIDSIKNNI